MKQALQPLPVVPLALPPSLNSTPSRSPAATVTESVSLHDWLLLPEMAQESVVVEAFLRTVTVQESPLPGAWLT